MEANTKKVNDKTYFWCPTHQAWTIHRPEEFKLKAEGKSSHTSNQHRPDTKPLSRALASILSEINSEENEWGATGSGGHCLWLGILTLNLIISSAHLLPEFLTADALDIIIMMIVETITVMVVSEGSRKVCKKCKLEKTRYELNNDNYRMDQVQN